MNGQSPLWRILLDVLLAGVGIFMALHETLTREPRWPILMVALAFVAGPTAIRSIVEAWFGKR